MPFLKRNRPKSRYLFLQYFSFTWLGIVASVLGPLLPAVRTSLKLTYSQAGFIFACQNLGGLAILFISGFLVQRFGKQVVLRLGFLLLGLGLFLAAVGLWYALILLAYALIGSGFSLLDVGISTICLELNIRQRGKALNRLHFFFGLGAISGPLLAFFFSNFTSGWRWALGLTAVGPSFLLLYLLPQRLPPSPKQSFTKSLGIYRKPLLWSAALTLCFYCGLEWGIGSWFASWWKENANSVFLDPSLLTSLFWLSFTVGRFLTSLSVEGLGLSRFLLSSFFLSSILLLLWQVFPEPLSTLIIILSLAIVIAGQYPTIVALGSQPFRKSSGQVTSFLSLFAVIGSAIWPSLIGVWADEAGLKALILAELILCLVLSSSGIITILLSRKLNRK